MILKDKYEKKSEKKVERKFERNMIVSTYLEGIVTL